MDLRMERRNRDAFPLRRGFCGRNGGLSLEEDDARIFIVKLLLARRLGVMD
jgi:hypothetical protein